MMAASAMWGLAVASSILNSKSLEDPSASVHSRMGASLLFTPHTLHTSAHHCCHVPKKRPCLVYKPDPYRLWPQCVASVLFCVACHVNLNDKGQGLSDASCCCC